ncbi:MMPL family transporter [bacterium]|nr:MMPL family transporter [bacterium]
MLWNVERIERMQSWIERGYLGLFKHRILATVLMGLLCLAGLSGLPKLHINNTVDVWFSDETPSYTRYQAFTETFGSDEYLFVALDLGDAFTDTNFALLDRLHSAFEGLPGVVEVLGLPGTTDVWTEETEGEGTIIVDDLRGRFGVEPAASIRRRIVGDERFVRQLVSADGSVAAFLLRFETPKAGEAQVEAVSRIVNAEHVPFFLGGYIFAQYEMDRMTLRDYFVFGSICLVALTVVFWILFRSVHLTAIFLADCVLTVGIVLGTMGHFGVPIHLMTGILPPLLMAMAIADDIHLVERFLRAGERGFRGSLAERVARASSEVALPSFLSGLTTFAGFFSLTGGAVPAIGHFGFWSGVGILFTYAFSFFTVPVLLTFLREGDVRGRERSSGWTLTAKAGYPERISRICGTFRYPLIIAFGLLCGLAAVGVGRITVDTQLTNFFKTDSRFMRSMDFIESRFGNTGPVEIVLTSPETDGLKSVDALQKTETLVRRLQEMPEIKTVLSLNPVLKTLTKALHGGADYRLPDRRDLLEQELLLLSLSSGGDETLNRFVNPSWTRMRVQTRLPRMTNNEALELFDRMESLTREIFGPDQAFHLTGVVEAYARLDRFILETQLRSLVITLVVIALVFWLQVGRPVWALLALLPNVFPIILMFATMGLAGITLNVATATVAAITLGLADDDTVYFFYAYVRRRMKGQSAEEAMPGTLDECGQALWLATVLNVIGFSIFVFSSFRPTVYFGVLTTEVWILAILAEFFLLPVLLLLLDKKAFYR